MPAPADRFGLGWRPALAAGILSNLDRIDLLEVMAEDYEDAGHAALQSLRLLGAQVPLTVHGTRLGLASTVPVERRWLDQMARVVDAAMPLYWSEHLAFVRGGGAEIGHLAAPPRRPETIDGLAANLERARRVVGALPLVENIATLVEPPLSTLNEAEWIGGCLRTTGAALLLDLHNLYCNAANFAFDVGACLKQLPLDRIRAVHIAGGKRLPAGRLLDDHLHAVPDPVFALLETVAALAPQPLDIVLERDGAFPAIEVLLAELDRARHAVAVGRNAAVGRAA
jgi:uncharacterized protein